MSNDDRANILPPSVKFNLPSSMYSIKIEAVRLCRDQAHTIYVYNAKIAPGKMPHYNTMMQIEIRVLPDGTIELFHDDNIEIDVKSFKKYYTPTYADFENKP